MSFKGWLTADIWHTASTDPGKEASSETSILEQRKSCFTGLSSAGENHLRRVTRDPTREMRGFLVCCRVLPDRELRRLLEWGEVRVKTRLRPFSSYQIRMDGYAVKVKRHGQLLGAQSYCVHTSHALPVYDQVAVFYLAIKHRPFYFHRQAHGDWW